MKTDVLTVPMVNELFRNNEANRKASRRSARQTGGLLDPGLWPDLAFFALVDPNGATLPARAEIPSPYQNQWLSAVITG
jgi:hypothetical protein